MTESLQNVTRGEVLQILSIQPCDVSAYDSPGFLGTGLGGGGLLDMIDAVEDSQSIRSQLSGETKRDSLYGPLLVLRLFFFGS